MLVTMKNVVFWYLTSCDSCKNRSFGGTYRLHHQVNKKLADSCHLDDGGDTSLRNFGSYESHTAYQPRKQNSSNPTFYRLCIYRISLSIVFDDLDENYESIVRCIQIIKLLVK
jgi:hypothetical protein